ncbi:MAG TPA: hypothetical protein VGH53_15030 [Streptosporangiaceae bacterium]|jgi:hypothetical protein
MPGSGTVPERAVLINCALPRDALCPVQIRENRPTARADERVSDERMVMRQPECRLGSAVGEKSQS